MQSVDGLNGKRLRSSEEEGILPADSSCDINDCLGLQAVGLPCRFWIASFYNHVNQFPKQLINLSLHTHTHTHALPALALFM